MKAKTGVNYLYNLALTVTNLLFPILSFPYASRILGPSGIGKVQFVVSLAQYMALIAALGIPVYGVREIARAARDRVALSKTFIELSGIFIVGSFIMGLVYLLAAWNTGSLRAEFDYHLFASAIVFLSFSSIDWFYAGVEEFKVIAIRATIVKLLALVALYAFVHTAADLFIYFLITIFSILANNILNIVTVLRRIDLSVRRFDFRRHRKPLLLIFGTTLASSMYTMFDTVLLGFLSDEQTVGLYTSGVKLAKVSIPFVISLGVVLIPQTSRALQEGNMEDFRRIVRKSYEFVMFMAVPITVGFLALAPEFVYVFSGTAFSGSITSMRILSALPFVIGLGHLLGIEILIPARMDRQLFLSIVAGMICSLLLNVLLIPSFHQNGASVANIVSEVVVTLCYLYFIRRKMALNLPYAPFFQALVAAAAFIPAAWTGRALFGDSYLPALLTALAVGGGAYAAVQLLVFKNVLVSDLAQKVLRKIRRDV